MPATTLTNTPQTQAVASAEILSGATTVEITGLSLRHRIGPNQAVVLTILVDSIATIEITLEKGVLTIAGTRAPLASQNGGVEHRRSERVTGRFLRRFTLPESVDADAVKAKGKHGVLEVVIPKREAAKPRKITVNS